jgi:hypothetical protein
MTCGTCRHLVVPPDKSGRRRLHDGSAYICGFDVDLPKFPACITDSFGFRWPLSRSYMARDDGAGCPCHEPLADTTIRKTP